MNGKQKRYGRLGECLLCFIFEPLDSGRPQVPHYKLPNCLGHERKKNIIKRKPNPGDQVMFPFYEGLPLCLILASQPQDCRLAVPPRPQL